MARKITGNEGPWYAGLYHAGGHADVGTLSFSLNEIGSFEQGGDKN